MDGQKFSLKSWKNSVPSYSNEVNLLTLSGSAVAEETTDTIKALIDASAIFVHSKDPIQFYPSEEGYIVYLYNEVENVGFIVLNFDTEE